MSEIPHPPWRKAPRTAPVKPPLGQERIVETAMRVLDAEGIEAVSMRRIAAELGTGPASLYAHVANKDELLELMVEKVAAEVQVPAPDPERWQEQIKDVARAAHASMRCHPGLAKAALSIIPIGAESLRVTEAMLAIMDAGGVERQAAAWFIDRIFLYINGDSYEGSLWHSRIPKGEDPKEFIDHYVAQVHDFFASLPADRFPHILSRVDAMTGGGLNLATGVDERFEFGLDLLVRGLATYAEPPAP